MPFHVVLAGGLAVLYMRSQRKDDACAALNDTLKEHLLGKKADPDHVVAWTSRDTPPNTNDKR